MYTMTYSFWTKEEENIIIENYSAKGSKYCSEILGRTIDSIKHKAISLGLKSDYNKRWSSIEDNILIEHYPAKGSKGCIPLLPHRNRNSIVLRAGLLNLKLLKHYTKWSHKDYEEALFEIESDSYPVDQYINALTPIQHECLEGHLWKATPAHILRGTGCPTCAVYGFNPSIPATLYYISIEDNYGHLYYKIGITNKTVSERFISERDKCIKVIDELHFEKGIQAKNKEAELLSQFKTFRVSISNYLKSGGNTELFTHNILPNGFQ